MRLCPQTKSEPGHSMRVDPYQITNWLAQVMFFDALPLLVER